MPKLSKLGWYWHRLRAMEPREVGLRFQKKVYQFADTRYIDRFSGDLSTLGSFPQLPDRTAAPAELLAALRSHVDEILSGDWKAFGHFPLKVDDPPKWHFDYAAGQDFASSRSAFKLDHRAQGRGGDIKIIWEPNRWYQLVRLAMAAWLLNDKGAGEKCIEWLLDWVKQNPPFAGLNWTSGLETGIRLIEFTWIDAFLTATNVPKETLEELRRKVLPPHVWYTWRYRSFGSSANNHLMGELAGIVLALARWPKLASISANLAEVAGLWEKEVIAQFAEDGGNKEQALGYHLFSLEFCVQCERAIEAAGITVSAQVKERIARAGEFYTRIKPQGDVWDYGDTDNAWVTPLFANESAASLEWWRWFRNSADSPALAFWLGASNSRPAALKSGWQLFEQSGFAICEADGWFVRFDFSPLGFPSIAPHGHLDALHLSVWHRGNPIIVDPGTGAYYADRKVRDYLADWAAHNSPQLRQLPEPYPKRMGTFLWTNHHAVPGFELVAGNAVRAELVLPFGTAARTVLVEQNRVQITDSFRSPAGRPVVATHWKFAPTLRLEQKAPGQFRVGSVNFEHSAAWHSTRSYNPPDELREKIGHSTLELGNVPLESLVSPAFRAIAAAPYLTLETHETGPLVVNLTAG